MLCEAHIKANYYGAMQNVEYIYQDQSAPATQDDQTAAIDCLEGYTGSLTLKCTAREDAAGEDAWREAPGSEGCAAITCPAEVPALLAGNSLISDGDATPKSYDAVAEGPCMPGWRNDNGSVASFQCTGAGWAAATGCEQITCDTGTGTIDWNETATIDCGEGFYQGTHIQKCTEGGLETVGAKCNPLVCTNSLVAQFNAHDNAARDNIADTAYQSDVEVECRAGFTGSLTFTCEKNDVGAPEWRVTAGACEPRECPPAIEADTDGRRNHAVEETLDNVFEHTLEVVKCMDGWAGKTSWRCDVSATGEMEWRFGEGACAPVECPATIPGDHGGEGNSALSGLATHYGAKTSLQMCPVGYVGTIRFRCGMPEGGVGPGLWERSEGGCHADTVCADLPATETYVFNDDNDRLTCTVTNLADCPFSQGARENCPETCGTCPEPNGACRGESGGGNEEECTKRPSEAECAGLEGFGCYWEPDGGGGDRCAEFSKKKKCTGEDCSWDSATSTCSTKQPEQEEGSKCDGKKNKKKCLAAGEECGWTGRPAALTARSRRARRRRAAPRRPRKTSARRSRDAAGTRRRGAWRRWRSRWTTRRARSWLRRRARRTRSAASTTRRVASAPPRARTPRRTPGPWSATP